MNAQLKPQPRDWPVLFNVEHVTKKGVQLVARDLTRAEADEHLDRARAERVPGRCVRVYLASREQPPNAKLSHGIGISAHRWGPLTDKRRAEILSEAE